MSPTPEMVKQFHAAYNRETGLPISLQFDRQRAWHELLKREYGEPPAQLTITDLVMVIRYIRTGITRGERNAGALRFRNLIEQPDYFEEELALARKASCQRQRPAAKMQPVQSEQPDGSKVTRLEERQPKSEPVPIDAATAQFMEDFRRRKAAKHRNQ